MPAWSDLTNEDRDSIIAAVNGDGVWDGQIAIDVYYAASRVIAERERKAMAGFSAEDVEELRQMKR